MQWINRPQAEEMLKRALDTPRSAFYTNKYSVAGLDPKKISVDTFNELPLLSRQELSSTPIEQRTFVEPQEVRAIAFTSGTSSNLPLTIPLARVEKYSFDPSFRLPVHRALLLLPPIMRELALPFARMAEEGEHKVALVLGDIQNMTNSAFMADFGRCDSLWALPTLASSFAQHAKERNVAERIKLVILGGETTTHARRAELATAFPNALIGGMYGSLEIGQPVLFSCPTIMRAGKNRFHAVVGDFAAIELIEGELVLSYGLNKASPLIRYRTGDYFEEVAEGCTCGLEGPVIEWSHRKDVDRLRINGMQFDIEEADRAFSSFPHLSGKEYQVHFDPIQDSTAVALRIEVADPVSSANTELAQNLARFIEKELPEVWRLGATATVRTALERGAVASFSATVLPALNTKAGSKIKRFINHVE